MSDSGEGSGGTAVALDEAVPALSPTLTPRPEFQLTRRLVAVSKWPLVLLTAIYAINISDQYLLPAVFPLLKQEFHLSDTALGVLGGSYLLVVTVGTVPFGILADRVSRTKIIAWGTAAWGGAMIVTGLAPNYGTLLAARTTLGISDPCDNPTSQSLLADYYPVNQRSKVMGIYQIGQLIGIFGLPIAGAIATTWGWRAAFYFFAVPGFVVSLLAWRLREPSRGEQDRRHQRLDQHVDPESIYDVMGSRQAYREIVRVRTFAAALASSAVASLFFGGIGVWSVTFLIRYHDLSVTQASSAISLFALGGLVGALGSGYLADYLTYAGWRSARISVAGVARIATFPLMYGAFAVNNTPLMLTLFTLGAMALTAAQPPLNAARADVLHPKLRGRGTSLDNVVQSVSAAASPILFGMLADGVGLRAAFLILIPLVGVGGIILLTIGAASYGRDERRVLDQVAAEARSAVVPAPATVGGEVGLPGVSGVVPTAAMVPEGVADDGSVDDGDDDVLLKVQGVNFAYGPIQVLFGVDLELPRGGCHALLGRNGVGKTTLLNVAAGLLEPQEGAIFFNGQDVLGVPPEQRVKLGVTLVSGGRATFPSLSLLDNLWMGAYPFAGRTDLVKGRLDAVLDVFPQLAVRLSQPAGTLSGGEQQMMAIGRALMAGPDLLLIDELSIGLAPVVTEELVRVIERIVGFGTTVLIVEQSVNVALRIADQVFFMEKGRVQPLGRAGDLGGVDRIADLMIRGGGPS